MGRFRLFVVLLALGASAPAAAQRRPRLGNFRTPDWWASVSGGYQWSNVVRDGATDALWNFDGNWQVHASLERSVGRTASVGVAWDYTRMPLAYTGATQSNCTPCQAKATLASYGLLLRQGGGPGLHQIFELFAGAMNFAKFERQSPRGALPPLKGNADFAWSLGYGFGYSLADDWQLTAMYDYRNSVHERTGTVTSGPRTTRHYDARVGVRVGF